MEENLAFKPVVIPSRGAEKRFETAEAELETFVCKPEKMFETARSLFCR